MVRLASLLFCLIALCGIDRAHGHAVLVESNPPDGAVLAAGPPEVVLRFNEAIAPVMVRVLDIDAAPSPTLAGAGRQRYSGCVARRTCRRLPMW